MGMTFNADGVFLTFVVAGLIWLTTGAYFVSRRDNNRLRGIEVLKQVEEADTDYDIVVVHGLGAHPTYSWTKPGLAHGGRVDWLKDFLPADFPRARVLRFGHNADWFLYGPVTTAYRTAGELLEELSRVRNDRQRPIIFVGHSYGGLIVKQVICRAAAEPQHRPLLSVVRGIIFLGTPHQGSSSSSLASAVASLFRPVFGSNDIIVRSLRHHEPQLTDLALKYKKSVSKRTSVYCFYETLPTTMFGVSFGLVVNIDSALGAPCIDVEVDTDHAGLNKCSNRSDQLYTKLIVAFESINKPPSSDEDDEEAPIIIPFAKDPNFVCREHIFDQLNKALAARGTHSRVALYGLGGVGKTQIAIQYAHTLHERRPDMAIFWIYATASERVLECFTTIARKLGIPGHTNPDCNILALVKEYLDDTKRSGPWCMVIDNADDPNVFFQTDAATGTKLIDSLPRHNTSGQILITTRDKKAGLDLTDHGETIMVTSMTPSEASELMTSRLTPDLVTDDIGGLLERLDFLPLAIRQATSFMSENMTNTSRFMDILENEADDFLNEEYRDLRTDDCRPTAIYKSWLISFKRIHTDYPDAAQLFQIMSFFDRQAIPKELLCKPKENIMRSEKTVGVLLRFGLITTESRGRYSMHRLTRLAARIWCRQNDDEEKLFNNAMEMARHYVSHDSRNIAIRVSSAHAHILTLLNDQKQPFDNSITRGSLLWSLMGYCAEIGSLKDALQYGCEALAIFTHEDSSSELESFSMIISVQLAFRSMLMKDDKANTTALHKSLKRAIAFFHERGDIDTVSWMRLSYGMELARNAGNNKQAEADSLLESLLRLYEDTETSDPLTNSRVRLCLGLVLKRRHKFDQAEAMAKSILDAGVQVVGTDILHLATGLYVDALVGQKKWAEAEPFAYVFGVEEVCLMTESKREKAVSRFCETFNRILRAQGKPMQTVADIRRRMNEEG